MPHIPGMQTDRRTLLTVAGLGAITAACGGVPAEASQRFAFTLTDAEWTKRLSPAAYRTLRQGATEFPGTSPLNREHRAGTFSCAGCALPLFASSTKFDSGTGWPSFYAALPNAVITKSDRTLGMARTEVLCRRCGGHLGHVFDDGPQPTGQRYCMNGVALTFTAKA